ncbi:MAG: PHP domain-containing protein, partial [Pseudomonadota bacterium]
MFIHLRVHSAYSLLEGALHLKRIVKLAADDGQPAVAVTDTANLFGALEFSEAAFAAGVQPIIGCAVPVTLPERTQNGRRIVPIARLPLIAASETGFLNLQRLVSDAYLASASETAPSVTLEHCGALAEGVIALTGWLDGPVGLTYQDGDGDAA